MIFTLIFNKKNTVNNILLKMNRNEMKPNDKCKGFKK